MKKFKPPTKEEVREYIANNPQLSVIDADLFWQGYSDGNWIDTQGKPVRNWKLKLWTWARFACQSKPPVKKLKLFPIPGKNCEVCSMPAVYKVGKGAYDHLYCSVHMPDKVKEKYE